MLTSDPIYLKPYKPAIYINNTGNSTNYYTYDPWTDTGVDNKPTHLSLSLSENTHGKFVCQIEDGGRTLNRNNINKGARFIVKVGKYSTGMTQVLSGLVREVADSRGGDRKDIYTLIGSSTSIRNNERVIYYVKQAAKLLSDGITIDITDPNMQAVKLLVAAYGGSYSINPNYGSEGNLGIINISSTSANSKVLNFIADMNIEFGEIQDAVNVIEEQSSSELIINSTDGVNLRYELTAATGGRGFTIKNKTYRITGIDDDADDTMYLIRKNWKYSDSVYKSDSYANRISGILAAEEAPTKADELTSDGSGYNPNGNNFYNTGINCIARKFRPTHAHCYPSDFYLGLTEVFGNTSIGKKPFPALFAIVSASGGISPSGQAPIVCISFLASSGFQSSGTQYDGAVIVNKGTFFDGSTGNNLAVQEIYLDTQKDYWMVMTPVNTQGILSDADQKNVLWWYDTNSNITDGVATAPVTAINRGGPISTVGTGWTIASVANPPLMAMPRIRSQSIVMHDPKAIKNLGSGLSTGGTPIEAHLPAFPSIIKTREAGYSYAVNQLYYMAKPRANYSIPQVTAPNICPLPGDPIVISDTVLGFSTVGNKVIFTRCGDMSLSWGSLDGSGFTYEAPTKLNINPVGNIPRYK